MEKNSFRRVEFLVITQNDSVLNTAKSVADHFGFRDEYSGSFESINPETLRNSMPLMVLYTSVDEFAEDRKTAEVHELRKSFPRSQIVVVRSDKDDEAISDRFRHAGAHYILAPEEVATTSKLFYLSAFLVEATYVPVPVLDFFPGTEVGFNAYHKLRLGQKYLPVLFAGLNFSDKKYKKLEAFKQIYVRREDLAQYRKYIETYHDKSGNALKKRCRAALMTFMSLYSELTLILTLDADEARKAHLESKLEEFKNSAKDVMTYLQDCPDAWNVIHEALDHQFSRHERGPYILAYALFLSLKSEMGNPEDLVLSTLLSDLGIVELPSETYISLKKKGESQLTPEELEVFRSHPLKSLNRAEVRKLEVSSQIRSNVVSIHERHDQKGFPHQVPPEEIPVDAKLISFCEIMDRRLRVGLEDGLTHEFIRKQVLDEEKVSSSRFSADFLDKIEKVLVA